MSGKKEAFYAGLRAELASIEQAGLSHGARYINLGDWISSFTYLEINPDGAFLKHWKASEHATQ